MTNQALQMQPVFRAVFTVAEIEGKMVVSAEISECDIFEKPCFYKGSGRLRGAYIRVGEADMPMTEYEVYSYEAFKRKIQDELRPVLRASMDSLDPDALAEYFLKLKKAKPNLAKQSNEKILKLQGITEQGIPTVAGIMMLGEFPQAFFPQLSVTAMVVDGTRFGGLGVMLGTENRFSGIPTVADEMEKAGLPPAVFESQRGIFRVTLYNRPSGGKREFAVSEALPDAMQQILFYCERPRSRTEIADYIGIDSPYYVVSKYIRPLLEMGRLKMTLTETPKSKNQKYYVPSGTGVL